MDGSFDEILNNIYESERESDAQHEYLRKLKSQISATENETKESEKKCHAIQEEIEKKIKRLANREVVLLSLNVRQKCLQERMKDLISENKDLKKRKEELKARLKSSREKLCKLSNVFIEERECFSKKQQMPFTKADREVTENKGISTTNYGNSSPNFCKPREEINADNESFWVFDVDFGNED